MGLKMISAYLNNAGGSPAPEVIGISSAAPSCGGCYVIADVAGIVFGSEILTQTAGTVQVSVGVGLNGTRYTTTSFIEHPGEFTFDVGGLITGNFGATVVNYGPTITVGGAVLYIEVIP